MFVLSECFLFYLLLAVCSVSNNAWVVELLEGSNNELFKEGKLRIARFSSHS